MKLQKLIEEESQFFKTREEVEAWLRKMDIENHTINEDLTVDVDGDVNISDTKMGRLPVQFGVVGGDFKCYSNQLTSLEGAPREVGGIFNCSDNKLTSLEGAPREVGGNFSCLNNKLTSLKGAPREVGGNFNCRYNNFDEEPDYSHINITGEFKWK